MSYEGGQYCNGVGDEEVGVRVVGGDVVGDDVLGGDVLGLGVGLCCICSIEIQDKHYEISACLSY